MMDRKQSLHEPLWWSLTLLMTHVVYLRNYNNYLTFIAVHYENMPFQIYRKFHPKKTENFQIKNSDIFHISAQNIDCGYSLVLV